jgi:hypothetical protein
MTFSTSLRKLILRLPALAAVLFCINLQLQAQTAGTASVQGKVTDPTGAAIPGARIILTNTGTGTARSSVADDGG